MEIASYHVSIYVRSRWNWMTWILDFQLFWIRNFIFIISQSQKEQNVIVQEIARSEPVMKLHICKNSISVCHQISGTFTDIL